MQYRIKSVRLSNWDYNNLGWYYITICIQDKRKMFGNIVDEKIVLNSLGYKCNEVWNESPLHYHFIELDSYVIMPNHIHGIIILNQEKKNTLGNVVGSFKSEVKKWANKNGYETFKWQTRFFDHIIRNEQDLFRIRKYIENNPYKWHSDEYYMK